MHVGHLLDDVVDMMEVNAQVRDTSAELPNPFNSNEGLSDYRASRSSHTRFLVCSPSTRRRSNQAT